MAVPVQIIIIGNGDEFRQLTLARDGEQELALSGVYLHAGVEQEAVYIVCDGEKAVDDVVGTVFVFVYFEGDAGYAVEKADLFQDALFQLRQQCFCGREVVGHTGCVRGDKVRLVLLVADVEGDGRVVCEPEGDVPVFGCDLLGHFLETIPDSCFDAARITDDRI